MLWTSPVRLNVLVFHSIRGDWDVDGNWERYGGDGGHKVRDRIDVTSRPNSK